LETILFLLLVVATVRFYEQENYYALGITSALMALTRGESILFIPVLVLFHFLDKRKLPKLGVFIIPAVILLCNYIFNYSYYGELIPSTFSAKIGQGRSGLWGTPPVFFNTKRIIIKHFFHGNWLFGIAYILTTGIGLFASLKDRAVQIYGSFFIVYYAFFIFLNIPGYYWYFGYLVLFMQILILFGLNRIWIAINNHTWFSGKALPSFLVLGSLIFIPQIIHMYQRELSPMKHYKKIGDDILFLVESEKSGSPVA
jgi:hypothetical protein